MEDTEDIIPTEHPTILYIETELLNNQSSDQSKPTVVSWCQHVVACNQVSRRFGIHEGTLVSTAQALCPELTIFSISQAAECTRRSDRVTSILKTVSPLVERITLDQSFVDVTKAVSEMCSYANSTDSLAAAQKLASDVRDLLIRDLQVDVRVGVGHSKHSAKAAASMSGQVIWPIPFPKFPRFSCDDERVMPRDRWRCLVTDSEVRERLKSLTIRLLALTEEDGRTPASIKISVRRLDVVRCTSWKDSRATAVPNKIWGLPDTTNRLLDLIMSVFHRLLDFQQSFHLTLLGLSFVRFHDAIAGKPSVASCILRKRELSVQMVVNISHELESSSAPLTRSPPALQRVKEETPGPCKKRAKLDIVIKKRKLTEQKMDLGSPSKLRVAELNLNCDDGALAQS